jgi:hypothetical protein
MPQDSTRTVTIHDVDQLVTGATPQFSQQIAERVKALIADLPVGDEARAYGEAQLVVLDRIATGTTRGTRALGVPDADDQGWSELPSHPKGGIAPGFVDHGH